MMSCINWENEKSADENVVLKATFFGNAPCIIGRKEGESVNRDEIVSKLKKALSAEVIDWMEAESLIASLGENINDVIEDIADEPETILSQLYGYLEMGEGHIGSKLTELFLKHGFDVSANDGINGAVCLRELCWSFYDHYILHIAELLLNAGADPSIDTTPDGDFEELVGVLNCIAWKSGNWMT